MAQRTDVFDLDRLGLRSGEGRRLELDAALEPFKLGNETYTVEPSRSGPARRLAAPRTADGPCACASRPSCHGPCMRCLGPAGPSFDVDSREIDQPGGGDELSSPYVHDGDLDVQQWTRDALMLALPPQVTCRPDCRGLCPQCGANLNDDPEHAHEKGPDARWAKLSEIKFD
jgi:uncharacterized protein